MAGDFGTQFMPQMTISTYDNGWGDMQTVDADQISLHPGAHVFHYASTCFEGLKASLSACDKVAKYCFYLRLILH